MLAQQRGALVQFFLTHALGVTQNDGTCVLHLIVKELTEVFHINAGFIGIHHGGEGVEANLTLHLLHGADDVAELADARRLDENTVGGIFRQHLCQRFGEITHQRAADAAGIHFGNIDAGILQKSAVDADLAKLIFN